MMNNIPFPEISEKFTIEDIHKIREWNYEREKGMTQEDILADIKNGADEFRRLMKLQIDIGSVPYLRKAEKYSID